MLFKRKIEVHDAVNYLAELFIGVLRNDKTRYQGTDSDNLLDHNCLPELPNLYYFLTVLYLQHKYPNHAEIISNMLNNILEDNDIVLNHKHVREYISQCKNASHEQNTDSLNVNPYWIISKTASLNCYGNEGIDAIKIYAFTVHITAFNAALKQTFRRYKMK